MLPCEDENCAYYKEDVFDNNKDPKWGHKQSFIMLIGKDYEKIDSPYLDIKKEKILISEIEGEKNVYVDKKTSEIVGTDVFIKRANSCFSIGFSTQDKNWTMFDEIISTMRFLD